MADLQIQDLTLWVVLISMFNYLVLYRKNKFFGGLLFVVISALVVGLGTTTTLTGNEAILFRGLGFVYFVGAWLVFIYDMMDKLKK